MRSTCITFLAIGLMLFCACKEQKTYRSEYQVENEEKCTRSDLYRAIDTSFFRGVKFETDGRILAYEHFLLGDDSIKIEHNGCSNIIFKYAVYSKTQDNLVKREHLTHALGVLKKLSSMDTSGAGVAQGADSLLKKIDEGDKNYIGLYSDYNVVDAKCRVILSQAFIEKDSVAVWVTYSLE